MDVTSLLNSTSTDNAAGQLVTELKEPIHDGNRPPLSRPLGRSRTPWDAGGYALPIHAHPNTFTAHSHSTASIESPDEPSPSIFSRHKMSDSRSSLSSYVSSTSSNHSRFSSLSTTSSTLQPLHTLITDTSKISIQGEACDPGLECHSAIELSRTHSSSPSLHSLAFAAAQQRLARSEERSPRDSSSDDTQVGPTMDDSRASISSRAMSQSRPASPSDVIFHKRGSSSKLSEEPSETSPSPGGFPRLSPAVVALRQMESGVGPRGHKRSYSAPDIPTIAEGHSHLQTGPTFPLGPAAEPTPPRSRSNSPKPVLDRAGAESPDSFTDYEKVKVVCMYIENCDTGSQARKAISHIFGRNKMCTRLIPQGVWVHYCRKHYQRSRYRNPKEYAKLQCNLVQKQIERLHDWSQGNLRRGTGPVVKDWGLAVRKREQKRLDELNSKGGGGDIESDNDDDGTNATPPTAVPQWLLNHCGRGYNTAEILDIFNRLHRELLDEVIPLFPDIEILPNIFVDKKETASPTKKPIAAPHRRTQSLGTSLRTDLAPSVRMKPLSGCSPVTPTQGKRKRFGDQLDEDYGERSMTRPRFNERPSDYSRRQYSHRPAFSDINEQDEADHYNYMPRQMTPLYEHSSENHMAPLAAPIPQRRPSLSTAAQLESSQIPPQRPGLHQRSQSDVTAFHHVPLSGRGYGHPQEYEVRGPAHPGYPNGVHHFSRPHPPSQYAEGGPQYEPPHGSYIPPSGHRHNRHQSTPVASLQYGGPGHFQYHPPMPPAPPIRSYPMESPQVRAVYAARR